MENFSVYQNLARRTAAPIEPISNRLRDPTNTSAIINLVGLVDEVGELSSAIKRVVEYGNAEGYDVPNIKEEIGDCLWRLSRLCDAFNLTLTECAQKNIEKLAVRYPEKYTDTNAAVRDLEAEREVLAETSNEEEFSTCPNCDGLGVVEVELSARNPNIELVSVVSCSVCDGTGKC